MQELNPNLDMQSTAARNLVDTNIRQAHYLIDTAHRIPAYLGSRNEPTSFYDWNQTYWPRENLVKQDTKQDAAGAAATPAVETKQYQGKTYTFDPASGKPRNDPKSWQVANGG